ncbi:hypothetical protein [Pseudoalteromonas sp. S554]|uniref:hypothetical protein n=1 Tax=Pseudoalteromonas sp. S554 TaxID=2066516 RepID=UPI00110CD8A5|nr:hypothetical protein [Pseudoalteromonas sp. S554]TMS80560.1 hypothetical protein CWB65_14675 [Pseudoalteromonas sp. S554]
MISLVTINTTFKECIETASECFSREKWALQPSGIELDKHKSKYGQVTNKGVVLIAPAFLGTTAYNKLKETMFHEIAHLIVGPKHNHNKHFKYVFSILTDGIESDESERQKVKVNNGYKYKLLAFTKSKVYELGGAFRRTKKYTDYGTNDKPKNMKLLGETIQRFEYIPYNEKPPENAITEVEFLAK